MDTTSALLRAPKAFDTQTLDLWPQTSLASWLQAPERAFRGWLSNLRVASRPLRPSTTQTYCFVFSLWCRALTARGLLVLEATPTAAREFFADSPELDAVSRLRYMQLLDRLYRELACAGLCAGSPFSPLLHEVRAAPESWPTALSEEELCALIASMERATHWKADRDRACVALAAGAGLRSAEIIELSREALSPTWQIFVPRVNIHREHTTKVLAHEPWRRWLARWCEVRQKVCPQAQTFVFATGAGRPLATYTLFEVLANAFTRAGITPREAGARVLRNTFAQAAAAEASEADLSEFLGHEHDRSTARLLTRLK